MGLSSRRKLANLFLPLILLVGVLLVPFQAQPAHADDGMTNILDQKYGMFVSYVPRVTVNSSGVVVSDPNALANSFDATGFANDLAAAKVQYVIFTAWHSSAGLVALWPSQTMLDWGLPAHRVNRDLIGDMITAVKSKGIHVYLYTEPYGYAGNSVDEERIGWGSGPRLTFDRPKWDWFINDLYRELMQRYGSRIDGLITDEASSEGLSDQSIDYPRLRATIKAVNPRAVVIQNNYGNLYGMDAGFQEEGGWAEFAQPDGNKWPGFQQPVAPIIRDYPGWWASQTGGTVRYSPQSMFRYTVLQAATNGQGGGVSWAAGPYAGGGWEPGVIPTMRQVGTWVDQIKQSLFGTRPSTSYPTVSGTTINDLIWGVATKSANDRTEYLHVLKPPPGQTLTLPAPMDGKVFSAASLVKDGTSVALSQDASGVKLTIPGSWDANDTAIKLTVASQNPQAEKSVYVDDISKAIGYSGSWQYSRGDWPSSMNGQWLMRRQEGDFEDDLHSASRVGSSFSFTFTGTGIDYIAPKMPGAGTATIYLDGISQGTVNADSATGYQRQQVLFRKKGLPNGRHTLKAVMASGGRMNVDALRVYYTGTFTPPPPAPAPTTQTVSSTDNSAITYNGAWSTSSTRPGDSFEYAFNGTGISYIAPTQPTGGRINIYIDGVLRGQANTQSAVHRPQQTLFTIADLPMGQHRLKAVAASGSSFALDSLEIDNPATGPTGYAWCAPENGDCPFTGAATLAYGADGHYVMKTVVNGSHCNNATLGDPLSGVAKACYIKLQDTGFNDNADSIIYTGAWGVSAHRGAGDYNDDVHYTKTNGDSFTYKFTGTGVDYIAPKANDYGDVDITITDASGRVARQQTVSAVGPRYQPQQVLYRATGLPYGDYTVKAVKRTGTYFSLDALHVHR